MVLTNTLIVGLSVLAVLCIPSGISEVRKRQSQSQETTTISAKNTAEAENIISTTQKSTISSKPKTDAINSKHIEQKKNRGSTKYTEYAYPTTESTRETTTTRQNVQDAKSAKLTTVRNDRSLSLNTDKYNSPEFHSENNIYSEPQIPDKKYTNVYKEKLTTPKSWERANFPVPELTTPKSEAFDSKYRKIQDDITKSFNDVLTTDKNEILNSKYEQMQENIEKSARIVLTTPRDEMFDNRYRQVQEELRKSLTHVDKFFDERDSRESVEKPQLNDSKLDYARYRTIEAIESKVKNKLRKDYNTETGMRMKLTSDYNNTEIIDSPGIVINTIPSHKDSDTAKKMDLDQGESTLERISIEKPEKEPTLFINNKIENEMINPLTTEGVEEKPLEPENIYLSKRGSTTQNREQSIEKSLSTESGIPLDLYPSRSSTADLTRTSFALRVAENDTIASKSIKKDKVLNRTLKPELEVLQPDLDNKIPKFLPITTSRTIPIEITTVNSINHSTTTAEDVTQTYYEVDISSAATDIPNSTPEVEISVNEGTSSTIESDGTTETINFYISKSDFTSEFFEATDMTTTENPIMINTELMTTEDGISITGRTVSEQKEDIMTENNTSGHDISTNSKNKEDVTSTTSKITTDPQIRLSIDVENTVFNYNQSTTKITNITEHTDRDTTSTENLENPTTIAMNSSIYASTTESSGFRNVTVSKTNDTNVTEHEHNIVKKNETIPNILNEITKPTNLTNVSLTESATASTESAKAQWDTRTEGVHIEQEPIKENVTEVEQAKQNEINGDKLVSDECDNLEESDDYGENNCKTNNAEEGSDPDGDLEDNSHGAQAHNEESKYSTARPTTSNSEIPPYPRTETQNTTTSTTSATMKTTTTTSTTTATTTTSVPTSSVVVQPVTQKTRQIEVTEVNTETTAKTESIVSAEDDEDGGNAGKIAAIVISTIGGICLLLLVALLIIMKKRQKRFNYGQRCRPVSLDAYSMDNVSIHNSTRRKGVLMASKRSYGNPAFEDPTSPTHLLNISELLKFTNNQDGIKNEFEKIPQVTTKTNELPEGCDVKNRYANVIPLPETRVFLNPIEGILSSDYINANYVTGPQATRHYYIACQAPMQNTIEDFWRMIWEQQSKVVLMITHLYENGVEKCIDYLPPSEVLDCHRLFGDYQITLKKREVKDKYIISSLQLKNMVSNSWREVTHLWYMGWPEKGVPEEANSLITFLIEARSCMKIGENKVKETNDPSISNGFTPNTNPVVVHCSPGTGRTGTVIACDIAVREFELTRRVDIPRIVYKVRRDRASAVQTKEQYAFIYKVIHFYATKLTGGAFDSF